MTVCWVAHQQILCRFWTIQEQSFAVERKNTKLSIRGECCSKQQLKTTIIFSSSHNQVFLDKTIQGERCNAVNPTKHQPVKEGQTTTMWTSCPTLCEKCVGSLMPLANQYREDAGDSLRFIILTLSEKTRTSTGNHLQMSLQRQDILLSYFKTPSVGPVWGLNPLPPAWQSGTLPILLS